MRSTRTTRCAIVLAAALSLPAFAQGTGPTESAEASRSATTADNTLRDDDGGFEWGWLGLIGLAGLLGLRKQPGIHRTDTTRTPSRAAP